MQIIYDGHIFRWQRTGGVSRYFYEIISRLPADWQPAILGVPPEADNLPRHPRLSVSGVSSLKPRRFSQPIKKAWWKARVLSQAQVFHPTYYNLTGGLKFSDIRCPLVITAHDFVQARHPHLEDEAEETMKHQHASIPRAAHVICVSRATEQDLLERYPALQGRTSVIYHGSSFAVCDLPVSENIFDSPVFLFVGRRGTYKNFLFLMRAFARACEVHSRIRLRVVGEPLNQEERWQIHFLGLTGRIDSSVFPDEKELERLYQQSVALLYPSRFEGFGIPPLEAMACGTVAVTSNTTSLPEVVGDAGIMLDPTDEEAWTECILQVANRKIPRAELMDRGRKRAACLSWEDSARRHAAVYRALA